MGDKPTHIREPGVWDIAHSMTQTTIARHGIRTAVKIIEEMQHRVADAVYDQQRKHPEEWTGAAVPPVPAQSAQTGPSATKNATKIPQIPRVGG